VELLERGAALRALGRGLDSAASEQGRLAVVHGEAGIGKTALVRAFVAGHAEHARVLWGACDDLTTPRSLGPLLDVAAEVHDELRHAIHEAEPVFDLMIAELRRPPSPVIFVIEDLHWADEATLDLLTFLVRRLDEVPVLLLLTYRSDELDPVHPLRRITSRAPRHATIRIGLEPLSIEAVTKLAGAQGPELHRLTRGNPFYLMELLADPNLPPLAVMDSVLARTAGLARSTRRLLELVSLLPGRAETALLDRLAPRWVSDIAEAEQRGLVHLGDGAVAFRHEVARQALAETVPVSRSTEMHRRILAALVELGADPARLVHHAVGAGDDEAVLRHSLEAARRAAQLRSHPEAVEHFRRADALSDLLSPRERADLQADRLEACLRAGEMIEAVEAGERGLGMRRQVGDVEGAGRMLRRLAQLHWALGHRAESDRCGEEAVRVLSTRPPGPDLAWALAVQAGHAMSAWREADALRWGEQARVLAEQGEDHELLAYILLVLGQTLIEHDEDGTPLLERSIELARAMNDHDHVCVVFANLAGAAVEHRRHATAQRFLDRGSCYAEEHDVVTVGEYLVGLRSRLELDRANWREAEALARWVLERGSDSVVNRHNALHTMARLHVRRGTPDAGQAVADALARASESGELQWIVPATLARAELSELTGSLADEREALRSLFDRVRASRVAWATGEVGRWLARAGEDLDASALPEPFDLEVAGRWADAAQMWDDLGCPYERADALSRSADQEDLLAALAIFNRLRASAAAARVRDALRSQGVRHLPRGPDARAPAHPAGLTARQVDVLNLVTEGLTNAEIAERFVVSVRTVDHHVSAVLDKLGVQNRRQAAERAQQLGLVAV
jgi:DNA-binding CsgD family transcriptional regulator